MAKLDISQKQDDVVHKRVKEIPPALRAIGFDDRNGWLKAYAARRWKPITIRRAALRSFRERFLLSQGSACIKCGISSASWFRWESGLAEMNFKTRLAFIESGWLMPYHFGIDSITGEFSA